MFRLLGSVVLVFLAAAAFVWLAERPGEFLLVWQGYEIRTSVMVAAVAVVLFIGAIALIGAVVRAILTTPQNVGHFLGARRRDKGYRALTRGMIAVGAGDVKAARRAAQESQSLLGREPLVLLLSAQAAQISGDGASARDAFEALSAESETRVLGLHGLFVEARRQGEHTAARHFAEEAIATAPRTAWAGAALLEYRSREADWSGALQMLETNLDNKAIDRQKARRMRAVLDTGRALELEAGEPDEARALALEAHKLAPDLVPAAALAARLFVRAGEIRRATRLLEATWKVEPHPDIAEAYAAVRPGDSVLDRLKRVRQLASLKANHPEGALAIARAAIDARDWQAARTALGGAMRANPTERACRLMAEIEEGEHGDDGRVRAWLTRALMAPRDPAWVADGQVFAAWAPISPVSGRIDAFEWRVPSDRPPAGSIEIEAVEPAEPVGPTGPTGPVGEAAVPEEPKSRSKPTIVAEMARDAPRQAPASAAASNPASAKGVRPLARAPDDPGPDTDIEGEPVPLDPYRPGRTA